MALGAISNAAWHALPVSEVLDLQGVDAGTGLAETEVAHRRERFRPNRFTEAKSEPRWRAFVRQYQDLMQIVLVAAAIASFWPVKEYETGLVLIAITVFNALLGMQQEGKAAAAVAALSRMMTDEIKYSAFVKPVIVNTRRPNTNTTTRPTARKRPQRSTGQTTSQTEQQTSDRHLPPYSGTGIRWLMPGGRLFRVGCAAA
jgi:magnesium-transporting ATPase (P-type)